MDRSHSSGKHRNVSFSPDFSTPPIVTAETLKIFVKNMVTGLKEGLGSSTLTV